jgi:16S rRNA (guanine966-N2)-methyltransferase
MRITGGLSRGRLLAPLKGLAIRPTADKVREAIFNLLGQDMTGRRILDLFAGTGILGIEALSRGAKWAFFIDHSRQSIQLIQKNLISCGYESSGHVLKRDLKRGLPWKNPLIKEGIDLAFVDPPYGKDFILPVLQKLSEKEILQPASIVVTETFKTDPVPDTVGQLRLHNTKFYGETKIGIYYYEGT